MGKYSKGYTSKKKLREFKHSNPELQKLVEEHRKQIANERKSKMRRKPKNDHPLR